MILGIQTLGSSSDSTTTPEAVLAVAEPTEPESTPESIAEALVEPVVDVEPVTEPPPEPQTLSLSGEEADAHFGGRISLVSTAPTEFVIRADGTRFEPGNTLPGGAVLTTITDSRLALQAESGEIFVALP